MNYLTRDNCNIVGLFQTEGAPTDSGDDVIAPCFGDCSAIKIVVNYELGGGTVAMPGYTKDRLVLITLTKLHLG